MKKPTIAQIVRNKTRERAMTVAEIVRETDKKPNTVRVTLNRMHAKGWIHMERFYQGRSSRAIKVISHDEGLEARLNGLICGLCGRAEK